MRRYSTGHVDDGRCGALFEPVLDTRNDLGLLAEYDSVTRRLLGNFPQGFSHIGLVDTAFNVVQAHGPAKQRAERVGPR